MLKKLLIRSFRYNSYQGLDEWPLFGYNIIVLKTKNTIKHLTLHDFWKYNIYNYCINYVFSGVKSDLCLFWSFVSFILRDNKYLYEISQYEKGSKTKVIKINGNF